MSQIAIVTMAEGFKHMISVGVETASSARWEDISQIVTARFKRDYTFEPNKKDRRPKRPPILASLQACRAIS